MKQKHFDSLGRIHIPKSVREAVGWTEETALKITADPRKRTVVIEMETGACSVCNGSEALREIGNGIFLCRACLQKITK